MFLFKYCIPFTSFTDSLSDELVYLPVFLDDLDGDIVFVLKGHDFFVAKISSYFSAMALKCFNECGGLVKRDVEAISE